MNLVGGHLTQLCVCYDISDDVITLHVSKSVTNSVNIEQGLRSCPLTTS